MTIAVFGASGRTGRILVERAQARGHRVVALVRDPARLPAREPELRVVQGAIDDPAAVARVLEGTEAAISVLGPSGKDPEFAVSRGLSTIVAAMEASGPRRLLMTAGAGVGAPGDRPGLRHRLIALALKLMAPNVLADMARAVAVLRASALDWTLVRLPMLVDGPAKGPTRAGGLGPGSGSRISREAVADYLLGRLEAAGARRESPMVWEGRD